MQQLISSLTQAGAPGSRRPSPPGPLVQRKSAQLRPHSAEILPSVHEVLRSPGQPLDAATQAFMEPRFGHDFSQVRVHADEPAGESARAIDALAYTAGNNIVFASGHYQPHSPGGRHLLAHELAHTLQQSGLQRYAAPHAMDAVDSPLEHEAERTAQTVMNDKSPAARPLDATLRHGAEALLGADFSHVRIHLGAAAEASARRFSAAAFTYGPDIYFGAGQFQPETPTGRSLLHHELTHTLQQPRHPGPVTAAGITSRLDAPELKARALVKAAHTGRPLPAPGSFAAHIARQPVDEKTEEKPVDKMAGALVTSILISKSRGRVGFQTSLGTIMGDVITDLKPGTYPVQPDSSKQQWKFIGPGVSSGVRFTVSLENANPWTLRYADPLNVVVQAGSLTEPKTFGDMIGHDGKMLDELWLHEDTPVQTPPAGPDDFETAVYDISYRSEKGNLSKWLKVHYRDNSEKDIALDSITKDTPNLWAARQRAYVDMDNYNTEFLSLAFVGGVWPILTMGPSFTNVPAGRPQVRSIGRPPLRSITPPEEIPPESPPATNATRSRPQLVPAPPRSTAPLRSSTSAPARAPVTSARIGNTALKMEPEVAPPEAAPPQLRLVEPQPVEPEVVPPVAQSNPAGPQPVAPLTAARPTAPALAPPVVRPVLIPVMPPGLNPTQQKKWEDCRDLHDIYKKRQDAEGPNAAELKRLLDEVNKDPRNAELRHRICLLTEELIDLAISTHAGRTLYINKGCDEFDWFAKGTTQAEREKLHVDEAAAVDRQIKNLREQKEKFCK